MKAMKKLAGAALLFACAFPIDAQDGCGVTRVSLYGRDSRMEYCEADAVLKTLSDSTVALFDSNSGLARDASTGRFKVGAARLKDKNLSSGERYREQPVEAFCSGFLVSEDLVVTAGHCLRNDGVNSDPDVPYCVDLRLVFGYRIEKASRNPLEFSPKEVYECGSVVDHRLDSSMDYAIIRLKRPVSGHRPLAVNRKHVIRSGTPLIVMGYPSGLPLKIAGDASVRRVDEYSFLSNLDTFGGNSGSPVLNARTLMVEGILVSGKRDYEPDPANPGFRRTSKYKITEGGERTIRISLISEQLPVHEFEQDMLQMNGLVPDLYKHLLELDRNRDGGIRTVPYSVPAGERNPVRLNT